MNKPQGLTVIQYAAPPGVIFDRCAVLFAPDVPSPSIEQLTLLARGVKEVEGAAGWWLGDIGIEIQRQKKAEYLRLNPNLDRLFDAESSADRFANEYTRGRADVLGIDEGYWRNCVSLCRFWTPVSMRYSQLTLSHHITGMMAAGGAQGDIKQACKWLDRALASAWSPSELRRQVNLSMATSKKPTKEPIKHVYSPLDDADDWAAKHQADKMDAEFAGSLLIRFKYLIEFLDKLKQLAEQKPS